MEGLSKAWSISHPVFYLLAVLGLSLLARAIHALLRAIRLSNILKPRLRYWRAVWLSIKGVPPRGSPLPADYWYTFVLGSFEMSAYPILIATHSWTVIGAWIGLKTVAQWSTWTSDRSTFNLFLIGNLLVFSLAYFALVRMVKV
jgi:hypothetical protein